MLFLPTAIGISGFTGLPSATHFSIFPATCQGQAAVAVAAFAGFQWPQPQAPGIICASQFARLQKILNTAVSDPLGRSQPEALEPLILRDGRILRCDRPAMPTRDCLTVNPVSSGKAFMLQNMCNGCGILATFNLHADHCPVDGAISPQKVEGITGDEFALYEHFSGALKTVPPSFWRPVHTPVSKTKAFA